MTVSGDPADILTSGFAFVDLLGDQEEEEEKKDLLQDDPWNQFAVRKHSLVPSTLEQGKNSKIWTNINGPVIVTDQSQWTNDCHSHKTLISAELNCYY